MTKEELDLLEKQCGEMLAIFEKHQAILADGKFDVEKVKATIKEMAEYCISDYDEMNALLEWMDSHEFYKSPASARYHGNVDGGLCAHSLLVCVQALKFAKVFLGDFIQTKHNESYSIKVQDVFIAAIAHDFCKAGSYITNFRNTKDIFGNWVKKPYFQVKDDMRNLGHGNESVLLLLESMPGMIKNRTVLEAVSRHMGFSDLSDYEKMNYSNFLQNPLVLLIQMADQTASGWYDV